MLRLVKTVTMYDEQKERAFSDKINFVIKKGRITWYLYMTRESKWGLFFIDNVISEVKQTPRAYKIEDWIEHFMRQ